MLCFVNVKIVMTYFPYMWSMYLTRKCIRKRCKNASYFVNVISYFLLESRTLSRKKKFCAWWNDLLKYSKICYIFYKIPKSNFSFCVFLCYFTIFPQWIFKHFAGSFNQAKTFLSEEWGNYFKTHILILHVSAPINWKYIRSGHPV